MPQKKAVTMPQKKAVTMPQKKADTMPQKKVVTLHLKTPHLLTWYQPLKNLRLPAQKSTLQSMKDQTQCNNCCHFPDHSCGHFCMLAASLPAGISSNILVGQHQQPDIRGPST